jgi:hypothetical protein
LHLVSHGACQLIRLHGFGIFLRNRTADLEGEESRREGREE